MVTGVLARNATQVLATDYAETMVALLRARMRRDGLTNVTCQRADLIRDLEPA